MAAALLFENPPVHQPTPHEHANGTQQPLLSQVTVGMASHIAVGWWLAVLTAAHQRMLATPRSSNGRTAGSTVRSSQQNLHTELQAENGEAENGEAAAADGGGGRAEGTKKKEKRGFMRSDSFKAAFGPTMVSNAVTLHGSLICS